MTRHCNKLTCQCAECQQARQRETEHDQDLTQLTQDLSTCQVMAKLALTPIEYQFVDQTLTITRRILQRIADIGHDLR